MARIEKALKEDMKNYNANCSNPVEPLVSCDLEIDVICNFMNAWQKHNSENCINNKPFKSVSIFMLEYCEQLRAKSN